MNDAALLKNAIELQSTKKWDKAKTAYLKYLRSNPRSEIALANLAIIHHKTNQSRLGLDYIERALIENPTAGDYFFVKGSILDRMGQTALAAEAYEKAQCYQPLNGEISFRLGWCYEQLGCYQQAIKQYEYAFSMNPQPEYAYRAGQTYVVQNKPFSALACYEKITQKDMEAHQKYLYALCAAYLDAWSRRGSTTVYPTLLKKVEWLEKDEAQALWVAMLKVRIALWSCDWQEYKDSLQWVQKNIASCWGLVSPWHALSFSLSAKVLLQIGKHHVKESLAKIPQLKLPRVTKNSKEPLRVAYLSADFRDHATAHLIKGIFAYHTTEFEIYAYSLSEEDTTCFYQNTIRQHVHAFRTFYNTSYHDILQQIAQDKLHILVDLMGFTSKGRPEVMAAKAAPIQVNYLGFSSTTGSHYIDYMISDEQTTPKELHPYFSEKLVLMPHTYMPTDDLQEIADTPMTRADYGIPENAFVFCCFNAPYKIDPTIFKIWMQILKQVPQGVLWLLNDSEQQYLNLRKEAKAQGVDEGRLLLATRTSKALHLARHRLADLFLDTFHLNAHTTAIDALWAGLPVLTFPGETFASRASSSYLKALGMPNLIATSFDHYQQMAIDLANTGTASLKQTLEDNKKHYPLFKTKEYTHFLEKAYKAMWQRYEAELAPDTLYIT